MRLKPAVQALRFTPQHTAAVDPDLPFGRFVARHFGDWLLYIDYWSVKQLDYWLD